MSDISDAAFLINCGLKPRLVPNKNTRYRECLERYLVDYDFREMVDQIAEGLELKILNADKLMVLGVTDKHSPFAPKIADVISGSIDQESRLLFGLSILAISAYCYPTPASLDNTQTRYPALNPVREYIVKLSWETSTHTEEHISGLTTVLDIIKSREKLKLTDTKKHKQGTLSWALEKAFSFLVSRNFLTRASDEQGGTYQTRDKFRVYTRELLTLRAFEVVQDLKNSDNDQTAE